jgi:hypothetical protein
MTASSRHGGFIGFSHHGKGPGPLPPPPSPPPSPPTFVSDGSPNPPLFTPPSPFGAPPPHFASDKPIPSPGLPSGQPSARRLPRFLQPKPGCLHTYVTKHELRLHYMDGRSAGKTQTGTLDMQDLVLRSAPEFGPAAVFRVSSVRETCVS